MRGKTIVITGATSGIGEIAAIRLAEQGGRIVFTARDQKRGQATIEKLRRANGVAEHVMHLADLSLVAEQKRVAGVIAAEPQIDVLINNAGALFNRRIETREGLENTFALNHMSYFTITNLLLGRLKATPGARIVSVASGAHRGAKLNSTICNRGVGIGALRSIPDPSSATFCSIAPWPKGWRARDDG